MPACRAPLWRRQPRSRAGCCHSASSGQPSPFTASGTLAPLQTWRCTRPSSSALPASSCWRWARVRRRETAPSTCASPRRWRWLAAATFLCRVRARPRQGAFTGRPASQAGRACDLARPGCPVAAVPLTHIVPLLQMATATAASLSLGRTAAGCETTCCLPAWAPCRCPTPWFCTSAAASCWWPTGRAAQCTPSRWGRGGTWVSAGLQPCRSLPAPLLPGRPHAPACQQPGCLPGDRISSSAACALLPRRFLAAAAGGAGLALRSGAGALRLCAGAELGAGRPAAQDVAGRPGRTARRAQWVRGHVQGGHPARARPLLLIASPTWPSTHARTHPPLLSCHITSQAMGSAGGGGAA